MHASKVIFERDIVSKPIKQSKVKQDQPKAGGIDGMLAKALHQIQKFTPIFKNTTKGDKRS